jgi:hypothetical protein
VTLRIITAAITAFWNIASCTFNEVTDVSEVYNASVMKRHCISTKIYGAIS